MVIVNSHYRRYTSLYSIKYARKEYHYKGDWMFVCGHLVVARGRRPSAIAECFEIDVQPPYNVDYKSWIKPLPDRSKFHNLMNVLRQRQRVI